ncbi:MAG: sulfotransferase [Actinomycetota bacterium]|nr:sulfotransferase [Actinomycetota bacterium]
MSAPPQHLPATVPPPRAQHGRSVVVLGMHRSGTSVVTRVISLLGLRLCRSDDLYTAPDNPTGHWESTSLVAVNDRLLRQAGGTFTAPPDLPDGWERQPAATAAAARALASFRQAYPAGPWVWKDPRTCLTLPFWRAVLPDDLVAVYVHREPLEVAASLARREGLGKARAIAMWERYARSGLRAAAGLPVAVVRFQDLLASPEAAAGRIMTQLAELGVTMTGDASAAARAVSQELPASRRPGLSLAGDRDATAAQCSLLAVIDALPASARRFAPPDLGTESSSTTELLTALRVGDVRSKPARTVRMVRRIRHMTHI